MIKFCSKLNLNSKIAPKKTAKATMEKVQKVAEKEIINKNTEGDSSAGKKLSDNKVPLTQKKKITKIVSPVANNTSNDKRIAINNKKDIAKSGMPANKGENKK